VRNSLSNRLTLAAVLLLIAFIGIAGFGLQTLYEKRALSSLETQLLGHVYTLLSAAKDDEKGLILLSDLVADPRLNQPDSGLYAMVDSMQLDYHWRAASDFSKQFSLYQETSAGEIKYRKEGDFLILNYGVAWDDLNGKSWDYTISIASSLDGLESELASFRQGLLNWLGGSALLLLFVQVAVLRWGLKPLQKAAEEIKQVESGEVENLVGVYPDELKGLTNNINSLIAYSVANQQRYRKSLGDLAHSLKTPLALLQTAREKNDEQELKSMLDEQLPHIDNMIQYHLQRASLMGKTTLTQSIELLPIVEKIIRGLDKVYHDKQMIAEILISESIVFHGDASDLMELLGNLLDNAYKYGKQHVLISANIIELENSQLQISISDDGPGIDEKETAHFLERGVRADQVKSKQTGHGIGLDIVNDIVLLYDADLTIQKSKMGGAEFIIRFATF